MAQQFLVNDPFTPFTVNNQFKAISNGKVYVGSKCADPLNVTQQIQVYYKNGCGDYTPVSQPISTNAGGFMTYNGNPAQFVVTQPFSIVVKNAQGNEEWRIDKVANLSGDDWAGFTDKLLSDAGITPNGLDDNIISSQRVDAIRKISIGNTNTSDLAEGRIPVGAIARVTDRDNALVRVSSGGVADGYSILNAGAGRTAAILASGWMSYDSYGADSTGANNSSLAMAAAHATGYKYFYGKPDSTYLHDGTPSYLTNGTSVFLGNSVLRFKSGSYSKYLHIFRTNDDITYNAATPRVRDIRIVGGVIDGNVDNVIVASPYSASALRAQNVDGCLWDSPRIFNMPGTVGALPAIDFHFSNSCRVISPDILNTDRQGIMFWESTGSVTGGSVKKSRIREPIIVSSEDSVAYQGSNVIIEGVILDNSGTISATHVIRFSGRSDGVVRKCKIYGKNSTNGVTDFDGIYVTFNETHKILAENNDIYNCYRGFRVDTTGDNKDIVSRGNRYYDCDRPMQGIFGGARSGFSSFNDKCYGVIDRPFNFDFIPKVVLRDFYSEGGTVNGFINNYTTLDIDGLEMSGNTSASQCLNIGARIGTSLGRVEGLRLHDNTNNIATSSSNVMASNNVLDNFIGSGVKLTKIGRTFVWSSSTGKLYIKTTEPTNDTDGTIVGTQT